ncbi:uncharacterized protein AKAW2_30317A [Aspergillus luchuensis]|uniref:Uncharacterized protein n=1 Tax=Aspergillus kawachii TaxID=1069201 RepID=A0A7R7W6R5_ASPKA|nr:uncharacterized protein AKAW2_30317A [Aspergillus luchuensis]BCR96998.1 hypothetical protein AKAW2_30317A [Aspergillus luchuensis]
MADRGPPVDTEQVCPDGQTGSYSTKHRRLHPWLPASHLPKVQGMADPWLVAGLRQVRSDQFRAVQVLVSWCFLSPCCFGAPLIAYQPSLSTLAPLTLSLAR